MVSEQIKILTVPTFQRCNSKIMYHNSLFTIKNTEAIKRNLRNVQKRRVFTQRVTYIVPTANLFRAQVFSVKNYERRKYMPTCTYSCYNSYLNFCFLKPFFELSSGFSQMLPSVDGVPQACLIRLHYIYIYDFSIESFSSKVSFNISNYVFILRQSI